MYRQNSSRLTVFIIFILFICFAFIFSILKLPLFYFYILIFSCVFFPISFINTNLALIILIFSMLLSPELQVGGIPGRAVVIRSDDIFIFIIFIGWLAKMAARKELGLIRITPLNKPIIIYIFACLLATFLGIAAGQLKIKYSFFYLSKYVEYFLLFFMVANNLKTVKEAKVFVGFLLLTCFFVCIYAWLQLPSGERISAPFESEGGEPNTFAGYLLLMMGIILGFIYYPESRRQKFLLVGLLLFTIVPFVFTLSRGGWLGFFPMLLTFVVLSKKYRFSMLATLFILIILLPHITPSRVQERIEDTFQGYKKFQLAGIKVNLSESAAARIDSWEIGFKRWLRRPILGYGIPSGVVIDNQYTRVLTETGIIGFLIFAWLISSVFKVAVRNYRNTENSLFTRGLSLGFSAGLIGLTVQGFSAAVFIIIRIMEPFWFIAAILATLPALESRVDGSA